MPNLLLVNAINVMQCLFNKVVDGSWQSDLLVYKPPYNEQHNITLGANTDVLLLPGW